MIAKDEIQKRLMVFRTEMNHAGIDLFLITSTDPHSSEYVCDYDKITEFLTGCTSDNVWLIIDQKTARLWTDGRYFISAARELEGTGVELMKMGQPGVPTVEQYLRLTLEQGMVLGFDGRYVSAMEGKKYREAAALCGAVTESKTDLVSRIWVGRPARSCAPVRVLPVELSGKTCAEKMAVVRREMQKLGCSYYILSRLDDIMWTLNIRGGDIPCCPVALSYLLIGTDTADLFLQPEAVTPALQSYLHDNRIKLHEYDSFFDYIKSYHYDGRVLFDKSASSDALSHLLKDKGDILDHTNLTTGMKAVKNSVEIENSRRCYLEDSAAVCRFIYRIKKMAEEDNFDEYGAAMLMDSLRREIPGFIDLSFPTISAVGPNAAMAHYAAPEEGSAALGNSGFLLVDSGGHYEGGTTDVTRTIVLGDLTPEMKRDFTLVAAANLALLYAVFAEGTTGSQLDMLAREPLYRHRLNYNHGTGHGIGYMLNVHEGPQRIGAARQGSPDPALVPGMITSDEPGVYKEGRYGIRTESVLLTVEDDSSEFGRFFKFEPLTYVPIDLDAIDTEYLEASDILRLNDYHARVREKISPYLNEEERAWLFAATEPVRAE